MREKLLIVDDEVDVTSVLKIGLENRGFYVDAFNDPTVALSEFKPDLYNIAVLDIRMPKMTGFELYRQLKRVDSELDICFSTAFDVYEKEFQEIFPDVKVKAFFRKPISIAEMATKLHGILDGRSQDHLTLRP